MYAVSALAWTSDHVCEGDSTRASCRIDEELVQLEAKHVGSKQFGMCFVSPELIPRWNCLQPEVPGAAQLQPHPLPASASACHTHS